MKKLLFLGGAKTQTAAIRAAKEMGYYSILCDYLPDNPGRAIADEWYPASTIDYTAVLKVAEDRQIDGILTYGSDVAASTAAFVAEKLGLPGSPYDSVYTLTHKDKFRQFLKENGFNTPWVASFTAEERQEAEEFIRKQNLPVIVKPVDSQGAKGISKVNDCREAAAAVGYAVSVSRCGRFIVEEYIERKGFQVGGDGFSINGELVYAPFSNTYFRDEPGMECIPLSEFWPPVSSAVLLERMKDEFQRAIRLLGMRTQAYNFEAIEDKNGKIYILEIGPRSGGNLIPAMTEKMTGADETAAILCSAAGDKVNIPEMHSIDGFWASRSICGTGKGRLRNLEFDRDFMDHNLRIVEQYIENGAIVPEMRNLSTSVAFVGARFDTREEMMDFVRKPEKHVYVRLFDE